MKPRLAPERSDVEMVASRCMIGASARRSWRLRQAQAGSFASARPHPATWASLSASVLLLVACSNTRPSPGIQAEPSASASAMVSATPRSDAPALAIDPKGIRDGDALLVPFGDDRSKGADESQKRSGPNDLFLVPVGAWLTRQRSDGHLGRALTVVVQRETPYRSLIELLFTAGQSEVTVFDLYETATTGRLVHVELPAFRAPADLEVMHASQTLQLSVFLLPDGVSLKTMGGNVAPGCREIGAGLAVPRVDGKLDVLAVAACVRSLKAGSPAYATEDTMTMTASPAVAVGEVFDLAIALRGTAEAPLFPKLQLGVSR